MFKAKKQAYLFVLPWSITHLGGVNQVVINLAREILKFDEYDPIVLILDWDATHPRWEEFNGLKIVRWRIRPFNKNIGLKERFTFFLWEKIFYPKFKTFCEKNNVAVINFHYPGPVAFTINRIASKFKNPIPIILSFHGGDLSSKRSLLEPEISQWRELLNTVHGVVACSNDLQKNIYEIFNHSGLIYVIHNGLDAKKFLAAADTVRPVNNRTILNVARFAKNKGQDILLQAFFEIANDYDDLKLVLVGTSDNSLQKLKDLSHSKGLSNRVLFFPDVPHEKIAVFFQQATLFALPSREEAFGIVLLEAGAFGLPVVASRAGGIPEILTDGLTGKLIEPDDFMELARCLRSFLDSPTTAKEMGKHLQQHVLTNFTWQSAYEKYVEILIKSSIKK